MGAERGGVWAATRSPPPGYPWEPRTSNAYPGRRSRNIDCIIMSRDLPGTLGGPIRQAASFNDIPGAASGRIQ